MQESKRRIPHFAYVEEVDVTALEDTACPAQRALQGEAGHLTMLPFLMHAMARVLPDFPEINARFDDDAGSLTKYAAVHIGIATQTPNGLMVAVVRNAEARDLWSCASEVARLAEAARSGRASREELSGLDHHHHQPRPTGRHRHDAGDQLPEVAIVGVNRVGRAAGDPRRRRRVRA
jgi:2-oxoisovalerate dehydrogenase E2 component (dihydrolipoyl transacylase)